jgi:hypothetical protein
MQFEGLWFQWSANLQGSFFVQISKLISIESFNFQENCFPGLLFFSIGKEFGYLRANV